MPFPLDDVVSHIRRQTDLLAECWEHAAEREIEIDADAIEVSQKRPAFQEYGLATWMISNSTTLAIVVPTVIIPTEWDGSAFAPSDIAERLVNAILPEDVSYKKARLSTIGEVAGAYAESTKTIEIPIAGVEQPLVLLVGLENPDAVQRIGHDRLNSIPVEVIVTLADKKIDMAQMLGMGVGTMITFEKPAEDFLDLYVNNHLHGRGEAVKIGEKFGLRVNQLGVHDERISPVIPPVRKIVAT